MFCVSLVPADWSPLCDLIRKWWLDGIVSDLMLKSRDDVSVLNIVTHFQFHIPW